MCRGLSILFIAIVFVVSHSNGQPVQERYLSPDGKYAIEIVGNGTGFFIGNDGWILTCNHVVSGADRVEIMISTGKTSQGAIVDQDPEHDLALLRVQDEAPAVVPIALDQPAVGDEIYTLGFPVPELEGFNPKLTSGIINSLTGARDDPDDLQISAPVQPGNSGGAVISEQGSLVGIASARLKEGVFLEQTDVLPQNVNYAKKASLALALIKSHGISPEVTLFQTKKEAFHNLSKATVFILVYSRASTPSESPSLIAPGQNEQESKNRIAGMVRKFVAASSSGTSLPSPASFYADEVFYDGKAVKREFIRQELEAYYRKWPQRSYTLISGPFVDHPQTQEDSTVTYEISFLVRNAQRAVQGKAAYQLTVEVKGGRAVDD